MTMANEKWKMENEKCQMIFLPANDHSPLLVTALRFACLSAGTAFARIAEEQPNVSTSD